jgi:hypothetical protein
MFNEPVTNEIIIYTIGAIFLLTTLGIGLVKLGKK